MKKLIVTLMIMSIIFSFHVSAKKPTTNVAIVKQYVANYNQQNLPVMLNQMAKNIKWMTIDADNIHVETSNKAQLKETMTRYFLAKTPSQSSLIHLISNGDFVSTLEKASWQSKGQQNHNAVWLFMK